MARPVLHAILGGSEVLCGIGGLPENGEPEADENKCQGADEDGEGGDSAQYPSTDILGYRKLAEGDLELLLPGTVIGYSVLVYPLVF